MKVALLCLSYLTASSAFLVSPSISQRCPQTSSICRVAAEPEQLEDGDVLLFSDDDIPDFDAMMDDDSGSSDYDEDDDEVEIIRKPHSRWSALNQNARHGMKKEKQDRVIKQRTESKHDKKRREYISGKK
jgi:hypothetical protein